MKYALEEAVAVPSLEVSQARLEPPGIRECVPGHGMGLDLRALPTQTAPRFHEEFPFPCFFLATLSCRNLSPSRFLAPGAGVFMENAPVFPGIFRMEFGSRVLHRARFGWDIGNNSRLERFSSPSSCSGQGWSPHSRRDRNPCGFGGKSWIRGLFQAPQFHGFMDNAPPAASREREFPPQIPLFGMEQFLSTIPPPPAPIPAPAPPSRYSRGWDRGGESPAANPARTGNRGAPGHREWSPGSREAIPGLRELPGMQFPSSWCPLKAWIGSGRGAIPGGRKIHGKAPKFLPWNLRFELGAGPDPKGDLGSPVPAGNSPEAEKEFWDQIPVLPVRGEP